MKWLFVRLSYAGRIRPGPVRVGEADIPCSPMVGAQSRVVRPDLGRSGQLSLPD